MTRNPFPDTMPMDPACYRLLAHLEQTTKPQPEPLELPHRLTEEAVARYREVQGDDVPTPQPTVRGSWLGLLLIAVSAVAVCAGIALVIAGVLL